MPFLFQSRAKDSTLSMKRHSLKKNLTLIIFSSLTLGLLGFFVAPHIADVAFRYTDDIQEISLHTKETKENPPLKDSLERIETPKDLKAIYMSQCVVGTPSFRESLMRFIDESELNAVMIDVKDFSGTISFETSDPRFDEASLKDCGARDMKEFLSVLREKNIYTIARITVFQDPFYTKRFPEQAVQSISRPGEPWKDHKGLSFVDVSSKPFWEYIVALSKEAYALGFDEINYDYIRYPSDGPMKDARYQNNNKPVALETFFEYLAKEMEPTGAVLSADLFGMTTTNTDDLNIGQQLERALPYFDYIYPMVYPSHYPDGFLGLTDPNNDPYKIIYHSMSEAVRRTIATTTTIASFAYEPLVSTSTSSPQLYKKPSYNPNKIRPWLQDFDYGKDYTQKDIEAQIQATYDAGLSGWLFWDAGNRYDSLRKALLP